MKQHLLSCGVARKRVKLTMAMQERRIVLKSHGVPHVGPPFSCNLRGNTFSADTKRELCQRSSCPLNLKWKHGGGHTLSIFSENDFIP